MKGVIQRVIGNLLPQSASGEEAAVLGVSN
jgi:hypothetical protein